MLNPFRRAFEATKNVSGRLAGDKGLAKKQIDGVELGLLGVNVEVEGLNAYTIR